MVGYLDERTLIEYNKSSEDKIQDWQEYAKSHQMQETRMKNSIKANVEWIQSTGIDVNTAEKYVDTTQIKNTALTPYEYISQQKEMSICYPGSRKYFLSDMEIRKLSGSPDQEMNEFKYDGAESILYWLKGKKKNKVRLANFKIEIMRCYKLVGLRREEMMVDVAICGWKRKTMSVPLSELSILYQKIEREYPEYRIYVNGSKPQQLFKQYVSEVYENSDNKNNVGIVYEEGGWHKRGGEWHYYTGEDDDCLSNMRLAPQKMYSPEELLDLVDWCERLLDIGDIRIMLPLLIHFHLGYTLKLYEEAGYQEQYVLSLIGASGSKKTSLARVLYCLFGGELINFTSTERAMELEMIKRQDSVTVLEDMSSGNDKIQAMKFERILRQVGDNTGRKKSVHGGQEQEEVHTRSAIVMTTESDIDALSKSSKLRTLAVHISLDSLDSKKLQEYQLDELRAKQSGGFSKLEQYMSLYIRYLEAEYNYIVGWLTEERYTFEDFEFARQGTIYKILVSQARIILEFWSLLVPASISELSQVFVIWERILRELVEENERRGREVEPYILFLSAIQQGIQVENVIAGNKDIFETYLGYDKFIGYRKDGYVLLNPELAYDYVSKYYKHQGRTFEESRYMLWDRLYERDLLDVYEQKDHKPKLMKQVKIKGETMYFLYVKWSKVEEILEVLKM